MRRLANMRWPCARPRHGLRRRWRWTSGSSPWPGQTHAPRKLGSARASGQGMEIAQQPAMPSAMPRTCLACGCTQARQHARACPTARIPPNGGETASRTLLASVAHRLCELEGGMAGGEDPGGCGTPPVQAATMSSPLSPPGTVACIVSTYTINTPAPTCWRRRVARRPLQLEHLVSACVQGRCTR